MTDDVGSALPPLPETDANEADVQEQAEVVEEIETPTGFSESLEVDEFDAAEQARQVDLDPDEYR